MLPLFWDSNPWLYLFEQHFVYQPLSHDHIAILNRVLKVFEAGLASATEVGLASATEAGLASATEAGLASATEAEVV